MDSAEEKIINEKPDARTGTAAVHVRVAEDDDMTGLLIKKALEKNDCVVETYTDPRECLAQFKESSCDIVITDLQMPHMDGISLLKAIKAEDRNIEVIIVTGHAEKSVALEALRQGAFDLIEKPFSTTELVETIKRTVRFKSLVKERDSIAKKLSYVTNQEAKRWGIDAFVGRSDSIRKILKDVRLVQKAENTSVLITGESGTGKDLIARAIHYGSNRASQPFVPVNCSAVPGELAESILFGHKKGSFTGATSDKKGAFEVADGGTLFLDEIGDMPTQIQTKLLRVLEDGVIVPVGKNTGTRVNVRIVAATNSDLGEKIQSGRFRSDLYYRLAAYTIEIPPLRDRSDDIPLLVNHYLKLFAAEMRFPVPELNEDVSEALINYDFPGNVRELRNMIERALIVSGGKEVNMSNFRALAPSSTRSTADRNSSDETGELPYNLVELEKLAIKRAVKKADGNLSAAARLLGISRTKLYRKLPASENQSE